MIGADALTRFAFRQTPVRGAIVQLGPTWQSIRSRHDARLETEPLLGEACAASALMFSNIKLTGQISLQLQGKGPLRLLLAQCTSQGELRAVLHADQPATGRSIGFRELTRGATLAITIERSQANQRYQGIVPLDGNSLAEALEGYFAQSEQLPTRLWLMADGHAAAGLMLQRMPGEAEDPDGWNRAAQLADTITPGEMLSLPAAVILQRLFHREDFEAYTPSAVRFGCACSRERVAEVLRALGEAEIHAALSEAGRVDVSCEFCNERYRFDVVDLGALFSALPSAGTPSTPH